MSGRGFLKRTPVASTGIRSLGYDLASEILEIEYPSGEVYDYHGVPPEEALALLQSRSMGAYLNRRIKPRYPYTEA